MSPKRERQSELEPFSLAAYIYHGYEGIYQAFKLLYPVLLPLLMIGCFEYSALACGVLSFMLQCYFHQGYILSILPTYKFDATSPEEEFVRVPIRFVPCNYPCSRDMAHVVVMNALWSSMLVWNRVPGSVCDSPVAPGWKPRPEEKPPDLYKKRPEEKPPYDTCPLPEYVPLWELRFKKLADKLTTVQHYNAFEKLFDRIKVKPSGLTWREHLLVVLAYLETYCLVLPYLVVYVVQETFHHLAALFQVYILLQVLRLYGFLYEHLWIRFWASELVRKRYRKARKRARQQMHRERKKKARAAERKEKQEATKKQMRFKRFVLALATLPCCLNGANHDWAQTLHAYVSDETGCLQTKDLPPSTLLSLRAKLVDFGMEPEVKSLLQQTKLYPVVVDSGASACSTPEKADFVSGTYKLTPARTMDGIASGLTIVGEGIIKYEVVADDGSTVTLECWGYHIPQLPIRLMSPQVHLRDTTGPQGLFEYGMRKEASTLRLNDGTTITVPYNNMNRLPLLYVSTNITQSETTFHSYEASKLLDEKNQNLSYAQKIVLAWHQKLNHVGFTHVCWLAKQGYLGNKTKAAVSKLDQMELPKCATCCYGKQDRRPVGTKNDPSHVSLNAAERKPNKGVLSQTADSPGSMIAMDQYVHTTPGRGPSITGITPQNVKYVGGTLFVDCATGYVQCVHQTTLNALETLVAKQKFEQDSALHGVQVKRYMTDNGVFTAKAFIDEIQKKSQQIRFCGVNAHHSNGKAERAIKQVHAMARCMMLHAAIHWPEAYEPSLWPFALSYACHVYNSIPKIDTNLSAEELWIGAKVDHQAILEAMLPWGCPAYVLDATLANGGSIPKFKPRSRRGQYLGVSPYHSQKSVGLIRNLTTHRVSPQFHVVYDAQFSTTLATEEEPPSTWADLVRYSRIQNPVETKEGDPHYIPYKLHNEWLDEEERLTRREEETRQQLNEERKSIIRSVKKDLNVEEDPWKAKPPGQVGVRVPTTSAPSSQDKPQETKSSVTSPRFRRSTRERKTREVLTYQDKHTQVNKVLGGYASVLQEPLPQGKSWYDAAYLSSTLFYDAEAGTIEDYLPGYDKNPWSLLAKKKKQDPDLPTWDQAMLGPHKEEFIKGMEHEVSQLEKKGTWIEVDRSSLPQGSNVIKSTWAFKIARLPDGSVKKFRSRFCVRGDTQIEGVDVFETYAPVVQWSTIRMCLAIANQRNLKTRAVDISNAFVSSDLPPEEDIYIEMPRGKSLQGVPFKKDGKVYKLKKSLYGLRQSPKLFFETLKAVLTDPQGLKFVQAEKDQCLFIKDGIIAVCYVDDILLFAETDELMDEAIDGLEKVFEMTKDDKNQDVFAYLGIQIRRGTDEEGNRTITFLQPGLINKILADVKDRQGVPIGESKPFKPEPTPAGGPLGAAKDDEPFDEKEFGFSYASAIGMLMYLLHTRADMQLAVHQCARFTHQPKRSHGLAVRRIVRYLRTTKDGGLEYKQCTGPITFDNYVDADFSGLYGVEDSQDPTSAKSRTGYVFTLGGNPVHFVSKLQSTISLSTVEAEYTALSTSLRDFLPMRMTAEAICKAFKVDIGDKGSIKSTVFEDNSGTLKMAQAKRITPRTKHINVIYHWFWAHTGEGTNIEMKKIDTKDQIGDNL